MRQFIGIETRLLLAAVSALCLTAISPAAIGDEDVDRSTGNIPTVEEAIRKAVQLKQEVAALNLRRALERVYDATLQMNPLDPNAEIRVNLVISAVEAQTIAAKNGWETTLRLIDDGGFYELCIRPAMHLQPVDPFTLTDTEYQSILESDRKFTHSTDIPTPEHALIHAICSERVAYRQEVLHILWLIGEAVVRIDPDKPSTDIHLKYGGFLPSIPPPPLVEAQRIVNKQGQWQVIIKPSSTDCLRWDILIHPAAK
jgi:hypothetical protein